MVLSYRFDSNGSIDLEEYIEFIETSVDVLDQDSLASSAEQLYRLSLNDTLLHPLIRSSLTSDSSLEIQSENSYSDATFILSRPSTQRFFIRANIWKVPKPRAGSFSHDRHLYSYDRPHDHNFDFLTVGYCGPGYTTRTYEYDSSLTQGYVGEKVDIAFVEETTLPRGKVMYYRKSVDIHTQKPPESLSVSLNLMITGTDQDRRQQYFFDIESSTISGFTDGVIGDRVMLVEMADLLGQEAIEPLERLASRHFCARTRATAISGLLKIAPNERERFVSSFGSDQNLLIQHALGFGKSAIQSPIV